MNNFEDDASYPPNPQHNNLADVVDDGENKLADLFDNGDNDLADLVENRDNKLADLVDNGDNNLADVDNGNTNFADDVDDEDTNLADVVENADNNLADDVENGDNDVANDVDNEDDVDNGDTNLADVVDKDTNLADVFETADNNIADDVENGDNNVVYDVDNAENNLADDGDNGDTSLADDGDNGDTSSADDSDNGDTSLADDDDDSENILADVDNGDNNVADDIDDAENNLADNGDTSLAADDDSEENILANVDDGDNDLADVDDGGDDYDTEDTEDDDNNLVEEIRSNSQMKGIVITGDIDDTDDDLPNGYNTRRIQDAAFEREEEKERKLKSSLSNYEFAPRKTSHGGRNSLTDWTEQESFVLLDAWGERFLKHNRKSVRSEEWQEVAEKVSEGPKIKRTETQCRNRLDTLKKQYKKEKAKLAENIGYSSKWVYFKKMDMYLSPYSIQANGYSSETSKVYMIHGNGFNASDSLVKEESDNLSDLPPKRIKRVKEEIENLSDLPPKRIKRVKVESNGDAFKSIAKSIVKFGNAYEETESSKSKHLIELENLRMDIQRDLALQRQKILEKTRVELAKIWGLNSEDNDLSLSNGSG